MSLKGDCSRLKAFPRVENVSTNNAVGFASDTPEEWNYYLSKILYMQTVLILAVRIHGQKASPDRPGLVIDTPETKKPQRMPGPGNKIPAQGGHFGKLLFQI